MTVDLFTENWTPLLMRWYDENKRELPWRTESPRDPYKVWVSEIMLQQTRVEAVKSYYTNWMEHFPDIPSLAAAEEDEVVRQWQGLGYYSRARNLHTAVREVMETYGGHVPETREEISKLKGIGEYTAGAILSMAYGKRETAVDGNVLRVFARIYDIEENILSAKVKKEVTELVKARQDVARPGDFNEALMDLGATVCIPGQPRCEVCPLCGVCMAKAAGKENEIPLRITKKEVPVEPLTVFVVKAMAEDLSAQTVQNSVAKNPDAQLLQCDAEKKLVAQSARRGNAKKSDASQKEKVFYLLHRRPAKGLLAGMWEFPNCGGKGMEGKKALTGLLNELGVQLSTDLQKAKPAQKIRHVFSHKVWDMEVYATEAARVKEVMAVQDGLAKEFMAKKVTEKKEGVPNELKTAEKSAEESAVFSYNWRWVTADELKDYNLAGPHNKIRI
ncbi:MAG: A/G-specific adenine glycosylase [Acidaminococcaceae bacterium]|nr:A/G-specific adenine glycosylase [Acidaminococcaceae bacterium]